MTGAAATGSPPPSAPAPGAGGDFESRPPSLSVAGVSRTGRRPANEDCIHVALPGPGGAIRAAASVCDGMGGHNAGEVASAMAIESLKEWLAQPGPLDPDDPASLERAARGWVVRTNARILDATTDRPDHHGMGTTLAVVLLVGERRLVVANVGDSRIFLIRARRVTQISVDHTVLAEQERLLGKDAPLLEDPSHSPFAHALTRSLGQQPEVEPDVRADLELLPGDRILLTSDGVTDVLQPADLLAAVEATAGAQALVEEIYRRAYESGSRDNISAVVLAAAPSTGEVAREGGAGSEAPTAAMPAWEAPAPAEAPRPSAPPPVEPARAPAVEPRNEPPRRAPRRGTRRAAPRPPSRALLVLGLLAAATIGLTLALTIDWRVRPPVGANGR